MLVLDGVDEGEDKDPVAAEDAKFAAPDAASPSGGKGDPPGPFDETWCWAAARFDIVAKSQGGRLLGWRVCRRDWTGRVCSACRC